MFFVVLNLNILLYFKISLDLLKKLGYECSLTSEEAMSSDEGKQKDDQKEPAESKKLRKTKSGEGNDFTDICKD